MFTRFMDMHSGGGQKEAFAYCYIEAPEQEAKVIFYNRFGHNPKRVTCTCCGEDYSINESETIEQATAYDRNCAFGYFFENGEFASEDAEYDYNKKSYVVKGKLVQGRYYEAQRKQSYGGNYMTVEQYLKSENVHIIYAKDIKDSERNGSVPEQGYIWVD